MFRLDRLKYLKSTSSVLLLFQLQRFGLNLQDLSPKNVSYQFGFQTQKLYYNFRPSNAQGDSGNFAIFDKEDEKL